MNATTLFLATFLLAGAFTGSAEACGGDYEACLRLSKLSQQVLSEDSAKAEEAVRDLRAAGPMALQAMLAMYHNDLAASALLLKPTERTKRIRAALDKVAGQKDAHASRLYWHSDFDEALAAAKATHRPILSLRMLGRLDEDLSCANSRFFRSALYANLEIASELRRRFVLHWKSVRPVPVITIDFGDGRKICRTITGNSIHYVLDEQGRPIEALPGLYGPKAFLGHLKSAQQLAARLDKVGEQGRAAALVAWHVMRGLASDAAWAKDLEAIGRPLTARHAEGSTDAGDAGRRAEGKGVLELPILHKLGHATALRERTDDAAWAAIAALHADDARLDGSSKTLMREKSVDAKAAMRVAFAKRIVEDPMLKAFRNFEQSMALDTVRNEYDLHRILHRWFAEGQARDVDELNERVYAQLFLTPSSDPWLGLVPANTYAGLDDRGLIGSR